MVSRIHQVDPQATGRAPIPDHHRRVQRTPRLLPHPCPLPAGDPRLAPLGVEAGAYLRVEDPATGIAPHDLISMFETGANRPTVRARQPTPSNGCGFCAECLKPAGWKSR